MGKLSKCLLSGSILFSVSVFLFMAPHCADVLRKLVQIFILFTSQFGQELYSLQPWGVIQFYNFIYAVVKFSKLFKFHCFRKYDTNQFGNYIEDLDCLI